MGRINLAQVTAKWQAVVITVMNVWVSFVSTVPRTSFSTISGYKYTKRHLPLLNNIFPPVLPYMQQIKILLSDCFVQRNINVIPDDGPVGSQKCRSVMF